jgi:enoyl-[acyl-carrier protein] reductase II
VVSSSKFALKCQQAGGDAVVAEGFEAGGHNGTEETTTMVLIPQVRQVLDIPLIAAGGIASGKSMLAAFALGAEGVQIGTRFALTTESSASVAFKQLCINLNEGDTMLALKKIGATRLIKNDFFSQVKQAEDSGATAEQLRELLGKGRAKRGIFEGELQEGELEIGQIAAHIREILPVASVVSTIMEEFNTQAAAIGNLRF